MASSNDGDVPIQPQPQLEVEQKFGLSNLSDVQQKLTRVGFVPTQNVDMVDWYFDVVLDENQYPLIRQDCWLRYREYITRQQQPSNNKDDGTTTTIRKGQWELKRGGGQNQGNTDKKSSATATVYEEIEGMEALREAQLLVKAFKGPPILSTTTPSAAAADIPPSLPMEIPGLAPLARIRTQRSRWKKSPSQNPQEDFAVDLDTTDFGYAVGEVELLLLCQNNSGQKETVVEDAQARLQTWIDTVLGETGAAKIPVMSKLEYYLWTKRPDVYQILVQAGVLSMETTTVDVNADSDTDSSQVMLDMHSVHQLIAEQYDLTLAFCNAQTSLWNVTTTAASSNDTHLPTLVEEYDASLRAVQTNFQTLLQVADDMKTIPNYQTLYQTVFQPHVDRTRRVLETVQRAGGMLSSTGIALTTNDRDTVMVGLVTLRASVDTVKERLSAYLPND